MNRTEKLRNDGATDRTGGGGGFVRWPKGNQHVWIEGDVRELWESEYGPAVKIRVTAVDGVESGGGEGNPATPVEIGDEVNVGLNYAALKDSVQPEDVGTRLHFAFEGWGETKGGDPFRYFAVLEVPSPGGRAKPGQNAPTTEQVKNQANQPPISEPEDDLPF